MKYFILALFSVIVLTGCQPSETRLVSYETFRVQVVGVNPPKHFYVDLVIIDAFTQKDMISTKVQHVYVSKHCDKWRTAIGKEFNVRAAKLQNKSGLISYGFDASEIRFNIC